MNAFKQAVKHFGTQAAMAAALGGRRQSTIATWGLRGKVPAEVCPTIERLTDGAVRCEDLCPDADWAYVRGTAANQAAAQQPQSQPEPAAA